MNERKAADVDSYQVFANERSRQKVVLSPLRMFLSRSLPLLFLSPTFPSWPFWFCLALSHSQTFFDIYLTGTPSGDFLSSAGMRVLYYSARALSSH